jgi:hypothetical protein
MGQEMDFKILRIEHEDQRIGLSARAVGKEEEPVVDTKMYSTEAKGGMASLGELANLKFGRGATEETKEEPKKDQSSESASPEQTVSADDTANGAADQSESGVQTSETVSQGSSETATTDTAAEAAEETVPETGETNQAPEEEAVSVSANESSNTDNTENGDIATDSANGSETDAEEKSA